MQGEQKEDRQKMKGKIRHRLKRKGERNIRSLDKSREVIRTKAGD
jgi:hypothetical protein